jgi:translation initiation factor 6 (eIF-6)
MCLLNPDYRAGVVKDIENMGFTVKQAKISELCTLGSLAKGNDMGFLVSPDIKDYEKKFLNKNLGVQITTGTVNFGSPYVSSGIVCNSHGFIIGDSSGGPEVQNADEALGFLGGANV